MTARKCARYMVKFRFLAANGSNRRHHNASRQSKRARFYALLSAKWRRRTPITAPSKGPRGREHARICSGRGRSGLAGARQHQHADRDQELSHPLRDLPETALCISVAVK